MEHGGKLYWFSREVDVLCLPHAPNQNTYNRLHGRLPGVAPHLPVLRGRGRPFRSLTQRIGSLHGVQNGIFSGALPRTDRTMEGGCLPKPAGTAAASASGAIKQGEICRGIVFELQVNGAGCYLVTLRFYNADTSQPVPDSHRYAGSRIFSCKDTLHRSGGQQNKNYLHQWETLVGNSYIHQGRHAPVRRARPWWFSFHSYNFLLAWLAK